MAETKTYGREDILKYLQHKMSPQEMHDFEKALMNDPFLADALEGFSASDDILAGEHLGSIERSIDRDEQKAKVIRLTTKKTAWWKVAAIVIVVVSAGAVTYSVLNKHTTSTRYDGVAQAKQYPVAPGNPPAEMPDRPFAVEEKSGKTKPGDHVESNQPSEVVPGVHSSRQRQNEGAAPPVEDRLGKTNANAQRSTAASAMQSTDSGLGNETSINDRYDQKNPGIPSTQAEGVPLASRLQKKDGRATIAAANEKPIAEGPDSAMKKNFNSPGFADDQNRHPDNKKDSKDSIDEDQLTLAEEVVATMAKRKNQSSVFVTDSSIAAEPVGGWVYFEQYMTRQLDSLKATTPPAPDQYFELEFLINEQGRPKDINVPAARDKITAARIIQLLADGPRWRIIKTDKKVRITVQF